MSFDTFETRHIGPRDHEIQSMLKKIGVQSMVELINKTIPTSIRIPNHLNLPDGISEYEYFNYIKEIASRNKIYKSYIGMGYYNTIMPAVIQRNILENPSWYTSYTPYQAEISQGRLEALLNFQTVILDITGMEIANSSLLDEATSAAEAMLMSYRARPKEAIKTGVHRFFVDEKVFPQTYDVLQTRAKSQQIELIRGDYRNFKPDATYFGALVQYPNADGSIENYSELIEKSHEFDMIVTVAADLLSLVLLTPPGEWNADVVVGSTQRFGIPMSFGGPHAAYFATREKFKRNIPGRIIGVSKDANGNQAFRMALQTREQHIKREKASSNICTAQALLATMAGMYAVYHGPEGLKRIALHAHKAAIRLEQGLLKLGYQSKTSCYFDTLKIGLPDDLPIESLQKAALEQEINLRIIDQKTIGISMDETTSDEDLSKLLNIFASVVNQKINTNWVLNNPTIILEPFKRKSHFLEQKLFHRYRSETEMMRYIKKLERKDISLTHSMISLGSCTMKLNAAVEMFPLSWPEFGNLHPFIPENQAAGYHQLIRELEADLKEITGFDAITFQPNSGAAGEYTGMTIIRAWHASRGENNRNIMLIPSSAHGTNPASAVMAGLEVKVVSCDVNGNIDVNHLQQLASENRENLAGFMVTYPSTHGVFEEDIKEMCHIIHENGGQVYMDGANLNAQVGLTNPALIGADLCHLNLHKTFAIPHGGGGPGMGPVAVAKHLVKFLPGHPVLTKSEMAPTAVSAAPYGSAGILSISHAYIKMMGGRGLTKATQVAILNANYLAKSLESHYKTLYTNKNGFVGHELILDCRNFKVDTMVSELDIAKRLMDYGFHAPTLSFPVHGTLMVEPTESESLQELDRFIEVMEQIYYEILEIREGKADMEDNLLKNAPHTEMEITSDTWVHSYSRQRAVFPLPWIYDNKFWPAISRIDDAYGDRHLLCTLPTGDFSDKIQ